MDCAEYKIFELLFTKSKVKKIKTINKNPFSSLYLWSIILLINNRKLVKNVCEKKNYKKCNINVVLFSKNFRKKMPIPLLIRYMNVHDIYCGDSKKRKLIECLQRINCDFVDIGIFCETRIPAELTDEFIKSHMPTYDIIRAKLDHPLYKKDGGGLMVYYNTRTVEVSNIRIDNQNEQIHATVKYKNFEFDFELVVFYINKRNTEIFKSEIDALSNRLEKLLEEKKDFFFVGDLNINVITDVNKIITKFNTSNSIPHLDRIISKYPCKQHNTFKNVFNHTIDAFITASNCKLVINCYKGEKMFEHRQEKSHVPVVYEIYPY